MRKEISFLPVQRRLYASKKYLSGIYSARGVGKTYILSWLITFELLKNNKVLAFSQTYKSLSQNLFAEVINRFDELEIKPNYNKGAMTITYGKGICYGYSFENYETCRGITDCRLLIIDELALAPVDILSVAAPCCRGDFAPYVRFCSTPRRGSYWNKWILKKLEDPDVEIFTAKMADNTFLSPESLALSEAAITDENMKRQELYGDILADTDDSYLLKSIDFPKNLNDNSCNYSIKIGIDPAGQGSDNTVACIRKGNKIIELIERNITNGQEMYSLIMASLIKNNFDKDDVSCVNIDQAYGESIYDVCKSQFTCPVNLVAFAGKASAQMYSNVRAEMYFNMSKGVRNGLYIDNEELREELLAIRFDLDNFDRYILVAKSEIKLLLNRSPDKADALALTYVEEDEYIQPKINTHRKIINILGDPND